MAKLRLHIGSTFIAVLLVLVLSTGFFIGFISHDPILKTRKKQLAERRRRTEETREDGYVHKAAPAIVSETLDGERWYLADQRGKVVLVFFWSVLCGHCIDEIPAMNELFEKYGDREDFVLVGVHRFPEQEIIACYCTVKKIDWPQLHEMGSAADTGFFEKLGIRATPTLCVIDREGVVTGIYRDVKEVDEVIGSML